uniref:Cytochrome c oxidase subunit 3 n=1 Tax=Rediviva intermixta TaxID=1688786 RepID=A0A172C9V0_9HYME|nr:cytochrome c oxidase subunit III [Rediviva intermixta]AKS40060.1 cytochrome c oxidase subunit III [Rediviva intermixta]
MKLLMMNSNHPFHMVTVSPWPFMMSMNIFNLLMSMVNWMYMNLYWLLIISLMSNFLVMFQWWRDVVRESTFQGFHTYFIVKMMKSSMILFIISELFFFISFFWTYIHSSVSPAVEIGMLWPPKNIDMINPYSIPLLNSFILVSSGFSITWSHYSLLMNNKLDMIISLMITIFLSIYFSLVQSIEYCNLPFSYNDSVFGSIFFMSTGFHGLHILIGTVFMLICLIRVLLNHFSYIHHFNFEAASWYWHFVDIIWLLLYFLIYWWCY